MTITAEQAKRCPRCNNLGETVSTRRVPAPDGRSTDRLHIIKCTNSLCRWYDTNWVVQEDDTGHVRERDSGHEDKTFPKLRTSMTQEEAHAFIEATTKRFEVEDKDIR